MNENKTHSDEKIKTERHFQSVKNLGYTSLHKCSDSSSSLLLFNHCSEYDVRFLRRLSSLRLTHEYAWRTVRGQLRHFPRLLHTPQLPSLHQLCVFTWAFQHCTTLTHDWCQKFTDKSVSCSLCSSNTQLIENIEADYRSESNKCVIRKQTKMFCMFMDFFMYTLGLRLVVGGGFLLSQTCSLFHIICTYSSHWLLIFFFIWYMLT